MLEPQARYRLLSQEFIVGLTEPVPNLLQLQLFRGYKVCRVLNAPVRGGSSTLNLIKPSLTTSSQRQQGIERGGSTGLNLL